MPPWARALGARLRFLGGDRRAVAALGRRVTPATLDRFLGACLDLLDAAEPGLRHLTALARAQIAGDADDRPVLAASAGLSGAAAQVPARAVFLAAMARGLPEESGAAAAMLANDLAAVGRDLPLRALEMAVK